MATELKKFSDAYATLAVAVYEPLILKWYSTHAISTLSDLIAWRAQKAKQINLNGDVPTSIALRQATPRLKRPVVEDTAEGKIKLPTENVGGVDNAGHYFAGDLITPDPKNNLPNLIRINNKTFPFGILNVQSAANPAKANAGLGLKTMPTFLSGSIGSVDTDFKFKETQTLSFTALKDAVKEAIQNNKEAGPLVRDALKKHGLYDFFPEIKLEEALSPIGIAHFFRQFYFNTEEGFGPLEEAFTIAPLETLEIVYQTVRRQIHEEVMEMGSEIVSESAVETKNTEEISDKVSTMMQRDSSAAMSVNGSYSTGVWQAGATASANMNNSTQRGREEATRRLKEVTKRASERITKTFSLKTRDIDELTTTNSTRRVIKNEAEHPVSYGLRRVLRKVHVKVQDIGPSLVWQLYIRNPGAGLAHSHFVHFREMESIAIPDIPPGISPKPKGGVDTGTTSAEIEGTNPHFITLAIMPGKDRVISAVSIDSITDLEGGGKDDEVAVPENHNQFLPAGVSRYWDEATNTFTVSIKVRPGDTRSVSVAYTYVWDPSQAILDEWENLRQQQVNLLTQAALNEKFEKEKALITEKSKIRVRPQADLRREERYELMSRLVSQLFSRHDDPAEPTPLEIEYFHRYFDMEAMFNYTHPSWWKPRYSPVATGLSRPSYEITAESEPAPMGSSLGWLIQLDGDTRRNEFLNSPWVRTCLPIKHGREREAIEWLSKHIEGEIGYNVNEGPLKDLLTNIEKIREDQNALGTEGADYVSLSDVISTDPEESDPLTPQNIYPIIAEFDVTVPTDGFVYDELKMIS